MKNTKRIFVCFFLTGLLFMLFMSVSKAFDERNLILINVLLPAIKAGYETYRDKGPVGEAIIQAMAGGLIMHKALKTAADCNESDSWSAWRSKGLMNAGASIIESAGKKRFTFRMDLGPVWMIVKKDQISFKLGFHSLFTTITNLSEGTEFELGRSLRMGTTSFSRRKHRDGTIGTKGALAYTNANNIVTDPYGSHVGHEMIHSLQYRRDAWLIPNWGSLVDRFPERFGNMWLNDTGWSTNWIFQSLSAKAFGMDQDFDIPMEKEAYYLADHWQK
ncbi:MAG: hypothetical protein HQM10_20345 [Candidatus Riflebacteria bacterium]|nr:hypothetical protein [Candidatus Riflebacteria bacterium]